MTEKVKQNIPGGMKLHGVYSARDAKSGTCIWEAENVQDVQQFLDMNAGAYAMIFCYEVDLEKSVGLPKIELAEGNLS